jgi:hypothetical protein
MISLAFQRFVVIDYVERRCFGWRKIATTFDFELFGARASQAENLEELETQIVHACVLAIMALATTHLSTSAQRMDSTYVESYEFLHRNLIQRA